MDWPRVQAALRQQARKQALGMEKVDSVMQILENVNSIVGPSTQARQVIVRLGYYLLSNESIKVLAPCCPDYTHVEGKYTFQGLRGGISLLAEKHISFVEKLAEIYPNVEVLFLYADHEGDDYELLASTKTSREDFATQVENSVKTTRNKVSQNGWRVEKMTDVITTLLDDETRIIEEISNDSRYTARFNSETISRMEMYRRIRRSMQVEEMKRRTIKTAAQYIALANFAHQAGYIICNHTTTNLAWYLQTDALFLHNPISVY